MPIEAQPATAAVTRNKPVDNLGSKANPERAPGESAEIDRRLGEADQAIAANVAVASSRVAQLYPGVRTANP